jgi:hypothetical protein
MGTNPKGCFLGDMGGRSLVAFQSRMVRWCEMGCLEKTDVFFSFVIW